MSARMPTSGEDDRSGVISVVKGCKAKCTVPDYIGDGNCDDENNNCACGYDKGDCCGKNVKKAYCKECKCKDPKYKK